MVSTVTPHQFGGEQARAAGDVEDVVNVAGPEQVEESCDRVVAGVDDDLVVDPRQPRVGLDRAERLDPQSLGLGGRELLVREHALGVELRQVFETADFAPSDPTGEIRKQEQELRQTVEGTRR